MSDRVESVVREYYDALRDGEPLAPYFLEDESTVKFGISESLFGFDAVDEALREQTERTANWTVESGRLTVAERETFATFADEVTMAWTDTRTGEHRSFETRWSGTLVPTPVTESTADGPAGAPTWQFAAMHVSTADEL